MAPPTRSFLAATTRIMIAFRAGDRDWEFRPGKGNVMTSAQATAAGAVVALWRYPVKSMQGEELNAATLGEGGLLGDRAYALVDADTGKIASAKNPKKWPHLFDFRARFVQAPTGSAPRPPVSITLPDGTQA